jgi:hypothetical protein
LDEITHGPKREFRLPPRRWLAIAAVVGLVAIGVALGVAGTGGRHAGGSLPQATSSSGPTLLPSMPRPTSFPGTVLLTCQSANWGQLESGWRSSSLRAGPLWFVSDRQPGYVRYGRTMPSPGRSSGRAEPGRDVVMIVEVANGSTVVLKAGAGTASYFRFLSGGFELPGDSGFTFVPCPSGGLGPNGDLTDFYLGFSITPGRAAPVEVWTPVSARPIWLTFTAPA